jgi:hypothetical protein
MGYIMKRRRILFLFEMNKSISHFEKEKEKKGTREQFLFLTKAKHYGVSIYI